MLEELLLIIHLSFYLSEDRFRGSIMCGRGTVMIGDCREVRKRLAEKKEKQPGHKSTQQGKNCCFRRTIDARSYTNRRKWGAVELCLSGFRSRIPLYWVSMLI